MLFTRIRSIVISVYLPRIVDDKKGKNMKYALIGCGRIAINHMKAVISNDLELVAACDLDTGKIDQLMKKVNYKKPLKKYSDYRQLINENPDINLVAIATDSGVHAEIAFFSIKHGINIIVEKPMAMSMNDAEEIIKLSKDNNVKVCVCHQNRFNIAVQAMRQAIEDNRFGKLSHGSINVRWNRNKDYYAQASWRGKWASDGGAMMNQCIHGIDLLRWMLGDDVEEVYGATRQQFHDYLECEDLGMAVLKFKNGALGTIEATVNVYPENLEETLYVFGKTGTVKLGGTSCNNIDVWDFADSTVSDDIKAGLQEETSNIYGNGHIALYADMLDAISKDRKPYVDAEAGKNALEIVLAVYKSQLTGMPVKLPLDDFASIDMKDTFGKGSLESK